jgi:hypothetical protein
MNMDKKALSKIIFVFILCVLCITGNSQSEERDALSYRSSGPDIDIAQLEKKIHDLVNKERAKRGLSVLSGQSLHKVPGNTVRTWLRGTSSHTMTLMAALLTCIRLRD